MSNSRYVIRGGKPLFGTVTISGAKNAAVAILPATILAKGVFVLDNIPDIDDISAMLEILASLGATFEFVTKSTVKIDTRNVSNKGVTYEQSQKMRASYYFMGALLGRFGHADVCVPGGCSLGDRPYDLHISGFENLGAVYTQAGEHVILEAPKLIGNTISFNKISVGATINVLLAAVSAEGVTYIEGAAKEPHVVDVANFLNLMGADIQGAGTDKIRIKGGKELHAVEYTIIPDQIEAGTFLVAGAATRGDVTVHNVTPEHLEPITTKLKECGCKIEITGNDVRVSCPGELKGCSVETQPHPGFPTDMQSQFGVLFSVCEGMGIVTENIWSNRFNYLEQLRIMGANIYMFGKSAFIQGGISLHGAKVKADDLRAGAAMVIAGLCAEGTTTIRDIHHIDRGYEDIVGKIRQLGGDIERVTEDDPDNRTYQSGTV